MSPGGAFEAHSVVGVRQSKLVDPFGMQPQVWPVWPDVLG